MKAANWVIAAGLFGVVLWGRAAADEQLAPSLGQPRSFYQTAIENDSDLSLPSEDKAGESPSDQSAPGAARPSSEEAGCSEACDTCDDPSCGQCSCGCDRWRLPQPCFLARRGVSVGGWLDQGITFNPDDPGNRFNGPVTFNDRSNEYQLNQLYLYGERVTDTGGYGWDVGGRVDLIYGTDHRFTVARGLEDDWNLSERFYGAGLPQLYLDLAYNDLTVRVGHFYTIMGYERVTAPDNFFYSHTYTHQYGEPFTHTGVLFMYDLSRSWSLKAGFDRGWNNWEDNNDDLGFLGRLDWTSWDERTTLGLGLTTGDEDAAGLSNRTLFSLVFTRVLTDRLQYVFQLDTAWEQNAAGGGAQDAEWYGIVNYLFYELNPCWSVGLRYEWFADDDGVRVADVNAAGGPPRGILLNGVPSHWQEIALGVRWKPNGNVIVRSELRWDWVDPLVPVSDGPFDDHGQLDQFLWGTDLIVTF